MTGFLLRKVFLGLWALTLCVLAPESPALGAQTDENATNDVIRLQTEISEDIAETREAVETELVALKLGSADVTLRLGELAALIETASEDMTVWGYTNEQRELHTQILSDLKVTYTAFSVLNQMTLPQSGPELPLMPASPDINNSDYLRMEIDKVSQGLNHAAFMIQSKLHTLRLDIADVVKLKNEAEGDQKGGMAIELPRTYSLALEAARLNLALSSLQVRTMRQGFDQNITFVSQLKRQLELIEDNVIFPEEVLNANIASLQERIDAMTHEMEEARNALDSATASVVRARASLSVNEDVENTETDRLTPALTLYMARLARSNYWEYMVSLLDEEVGFLRETQDVWRKRYKLFLDEASGEEIWKDRENAETRLSELQMQLTAVRRLEMDLIQHIETLQKQADAIRDAGSEEPQEGQTGLAALSPEDRSKVQQNLLQTIANHRRIISDILNRYESQIPILTFLYQRLYIEASDRISAIRIAEKVHSFSKETILGFLDTELWKGEGYSVTVWRLSVAVLVFLSSFFLSSIGSRWLKSRMLKRFNTSETAANATQRIVFYILWLAFALTALNIVKIPLTAFAFLGGAFAVGFGFGMQNIFNNLISGFIVIFSRPFKVNDIISIAGTEGTVHDIGSRSTTIKTWDGLDVVLPNRYFLENSVTNWTGSDYKMRCVLKVGVAYDADTRKVEELMRDIMKGHSKTLKDPAPFVVFRNFGDNALEFEGYYWIDLRQASTLKVASDMRHHLASVFRDEGIGIPYPQRDVHIIPPETGPKEASE
ncbi:MAG: mechanosensitive ion channel [Fretibacterium sp.]|nr:mechanosensitive ion channel [Fretibacterium sp.]